MTGITVHFWGVRGSIPCSGPEVLDYGGSTACVELRCGDRRVILDAGSGLRALGQAMAADHSVVDLDLLLTHCHLDHLIGLPFFVPAFDPASAIRLWAGHLQPKERLEDILSQLMIPPLLPITPEVFRADITYRDFLAGELLDLGGGIRVATAPLRHPGGATGYRVEYGGAAVCYVTDNEHAPDGPDPALVQLARNAGLLIYDAMYTPDEYARHAGWGHSTWQEGIRLADAAGVGRLALFHHAPGRSDVAQQQIERAAAAVRPGTFAAREGLELAIESAFGLQTGAIAGSETAWNTPTSSS